MKFVNFFLSLALCFGIYQTTVAMQSETSNAQVQETCGICFLELNEAIDDQVPANNARIALVCDASRPTIVHTFHRGCIKGWLDKKPTCPLCNKDVALETLEQCGIPTPWSRNKYINMAARTWAPIALSIAQCCTKQESDESFYRVLRQRFPIEADAPQLYYDMAQTWRRFAPVYIVGVVLLLAFLNRS